MRVLVADDKAEVRFALRALLGTQHDLVVVAEAADADSLEAQVPTARPDLILLDWDLPGEEGSRLVAALRADHPAVQVIALSERQEARRAALAAGADAFASKGEPPAQLLAAIETCSHRLAGSAGRQAGRTEERIHGC